MEYSLFMSTVDQHLKISIVKLMIQKTKFCLILRAAFHGHFLLRSESTFDELPKQYILYIFYKVMPRILVQQNIFVMLECYIAHKSKVWFALFLKRVNKNIFLHLWFKICYK